MVWSPHKFRHMAQNWSPRVRVCACVLFKI